MYALYIDHPDELGSYKYLPGEKYGEDVVSRILGIRVEFVCNSAAKISDGDIYEIIFDSPQDVTAFILKHKCKLVDPEKIRRYRSE